MNLMTDYEPRKLGTVIILTSQRKKLRKGRWLQGLSHISAKERLGDLRQALPLWASFPPHLFFLIYLIGG